MFSKIRSRIVPDIGIDLGSTNTRVCVVGRGVVLEIPSVLAINMKTDQVVEVGEKAKDYLGRRAGNVIVVGPLKNGRIVDASITAAFLWHCIEKVCQRHWWRKILKPRVVITVQSGVTEVEKFAMESAARVAGAGEVLLLESPTAAAVGAGLPVAEPSGFMIVEIGGSSCSAVMIADAAVVADRVCPGGDVFDLCIFDHLRTTYNMEIDAATAESVKKTIGSVCPFESEQDMEVAGTDIASGGPRKVMVTSEEIRKALSRQVSLIVECVREVIHEAGPKYAKVIMDRGIVLSGGGSLLRGLDELLAKETGLKVVRAEAPATSAIEGVGVVLNELNCVVKSGKQKEREEINEVWKV